MTAAFGASTFPFVWRETALDALRQMLDLGLNGFDVILAPGHCWPAELSTSARSELARTLDEDGIRVDSLNFPALDLNLASPIPEVRRYAVELYGEAIRLAAELGARAVVAVPGRVSALIQPPREESERRLVESVEALLAHAEEADQLLCLELHPQTPIPTVDALERFVGAFDHPRLRVAYDVANAEAVGEDHVGRSASSRRSSGRCTCRTAVGRGGPTIASAAARSTFRPSCRPWTRSDSTGRACSRSSRPLHSRTCGRRWTRWSDGRPASDTGHRRRR